MKVLMLGWEYPPHISGGLGTACEGLTKALARKSVEIDFLVPRLFGAEDAPHMNLLGASAGSRPAVLTTAPGRDSAAATEQTRRDAEGPSSTTVPGGGSPAVTEQARPDAEGSSESGIRVVPVPAMLTPYLDEESYQELLAVGALPELPTPPSEPSERLSLSESSAEVQEALQATSRPSQTVGHYGQDLISEVRRYALAATERVRVRSYDVIHAHDWMTFPAGIEIAKRTGAPLLVHIHSLEYDRAAEGADPVIVGVERLGLDHCTRAIAVSHYTRSLIHRIHGTALNKISVVHNGVYASETVRAYTAQQPRKGPVVLFLGRVTFQKGPEYFIRAAHKALQHVPDARFVMAGSGDMLPRMKALVEELGIADSFEFPGFVRGAQLEATFSTADVYVMPSVSEPFGIAPLEAMSYDRPVIVSRQSGVSEVLRHALKVDFWDIDRMASQMVALLEFPELRKVIVERAREEIRHLHWDAAADKLLPVYESLIAGGGPCRPFVSTSKFTSRSA